MNEKKKKKTIKIIKKRKKKKEKKEKKVLLVLSRYLRFRTQFIYVIHQLGGTYLERHVQGARTGQGLTFLLYSCSEQSKRSVSSE